LTGPFSNLTSNTSAIDTLLSQSKNLANDLSFAFNTPSGIPDNSIWFTNHSLGGDDTNGLATIGTLVLEWTHLSDLSGNGTYAQLTQKAEDYLINPQPSSSQPFPGLVGSNVYLANGTFADAAGGWIGGDDSFYEYLIKMYVYDSGRFGSYKDRWVLAADSSIKYLASHPSTRTDLTFLAEFNGTQLVYESQHCKPFHLSRIKILAEANSLRTVACFDGGNFLLGGLVLGQQQYIDFGLQLVSACHKTYTADATGIGPEIFQWLPEACNNVTTSQQKRDAYAAAYPEAGSAGNSPYAESPYGFSSPTTSPHQSPSPYPTPITTTSGNSTTTSTSIGPTNTLLPPYSNCTIPPAYQNQSSFYSKSGFWITNPTYDLRPEVLESIYYAYRITGNTMYQDWAWEAFQAINATCRVGSGYSQINNVDAAGGGGYTNNQESFWFAEVLKYAYLIQAADGPWQVNYQGGNQFVFNTEAHPFKVKKVI
jgi:mannosyl-oligosaccharide alpha-1,2-mannosidase